jgi:gluconolactonase
MSWTFELVAGPVGFAEGPAWDGTGLLFSDIANSRVMRYDASTGQTTVFREGTNEANGLMLDREGRLYACEGGGRRIARYEPDGGVTVLADRFESRRLNSPNDLAIDARGRSGSPIRAMATSGKIWNWTTSRSSAWPRSRTVHGASGG